jgi:hypothetical protein
MLTDMKVRALKPTGKIYKVADQHGLYAAVTRTGVVSFRFDYRLNGRRETLVIGQYDAIPGARKPRGAEDLESPRVSRRLQSLRRWSHEQVEQVLT